MANLHLTLERIIISPLDNGLYEDLDRTCYVIWEWCTTHGQHPWGWCLDRYCSCKVALSEHEPEVLTDDDGLDDEWRALSERSRAAREAGRRCGLTDPGWPSGPA